MQMNNLWCRLHFNTLLSYPLRNSLVPNWFLLAGILFLLDILFLNHSYQPCWSKKLKNLVIIDNQTVNCFILEDMNNYSLICRLKNWDFGLSSFIQNLLEVQIIKHIWLTILLSEATFGLGLMWHFYAEANILLNDDLGYELCSMELPEILMNFMMALILKPFYHYLFTRFSFLYLSFLCLLHKCPCLCILLMSTIFYSLYTYYWLYRSY